MDPVWLALPGFFIWLSILLLPWRPWSTRESLDSDANASSNEDLSEVTVLVPARNEAGVIAGTLQALKQQGTGLNVVLINDQSTDQTVIQAESVGLENLRILEGEPLPADWTGKLWALEQGRQHISTRLVLLLDADIELRPGIIASLREKMESEDLHLASLMAFLRMQSGWEKFLMPAFIYFFKLLYPFHLSNSASRLIAAAAGGCILIRTRTLEEIGGFASLKDALIDDCTLARRVKDQGYRTWIGLSHSAISKRRYDRLNTIWDMVARTAYTQLRYSVLLLALCSILMLACFVLPVAALFSSNSATAVLSVFSLLFMAASYVPTLKYYAIHPGWLASLPAAGLLYLLMTWSSALRHWQGNGAHWKDRHYLKQTG